MNAKTSLPTQIIRAAKADLPVVARLAAAIWPACYGNILPRGQIDYMLARMYSLNAMCREIRSQGIRYDLLLVYGGPSGFVSYGPTEKPGVTKLHKIYLLSELHGRGLGSLLLHHVEREIRAGAGRRLILSVNKQNVRAIAAYKRNGFAVAESVVTDIGGGFVMDDFIMAKDLAD